MDNLNALPQSVRTEGKTMDDERKEMIAKMPALELSGGGHVIGDGLRYFGWTLIVAAGFVLGIAMFGMSIFVVTSPDYGSGVYIPSQTVVNSGLAHNREMTFTGGWVTLLIGTMMVMTGGIINAIERFAVVVFNLGGIVGKIIWRLSVGAFFPQTGVGQDDQHADRRHRRA
jgi:hypothetical protein